ncbi:hypothetical protein LSH36_74g05003 [Paralvinella palmiformis]|uniref:Uncharacterized protein n=1 Tax=Paralvinella palmiformis TaxID=53620 RepID=A0AAD9NB46_9ANNE|nr:hypothetical protein LSH36_74g05003 [Paralvinella palmiformis]
MASRYLSASLSSAVKSCYAFRNLNQVTWCSKANYGVLSSVVRSQIKQSQPALKAATRPVLRSSLRQSSTQSSAITPQTQKMVGRWLLTCAGMCFGAVVIGGITRLTESGLSMTQWHIIKGMKPPSSEEEWLAEFERYKNFPEYKYLERELTLENFKSIFFWEYIHRMWGRSIALVFFIPMVYFLKKGYISKPMKPRLVIYGAFLVFQGVLGWYMVKSGLEISAERKEVPRVSQYRLAAHLGSAMLLFALFTWQGLSHAFKPLQLPNTAQIARLRVLSHSAMAVVFFTALSGAFVAGLDAGLTYNTWPKMADRWIPTDLFAMSPKWKNFLENATTTQFNHRHLGELTAAGILGLWWMCRKASLPPRAMMVAHAFAGMALLQVGLGVATLLMFVPVHMAATHQTGAMTLLTFAIWLANELRRIPK